MRDTLKVLIVAESAATRTGLRLSLQGEADCTESSSADALEVPALDPPDACLVTLGPSFTLADVRALVARLPETAIIVLTKQVEADEFLAVMRAGAVGYVSDDIASARVPHIVRGALRGELPVPRTVVGRLVEELRNVAGGRRMIELPQGRRVVLTWREWEVIDLLRDGLSTREIATRLDISPVTVRRHLAAAYAKLGVASRSEALALVNASATSRAM